jgi:tetratricopeptide (TPR) repeat protein
MVKKYTPRTVFSPFFLFWLVCLSPHLQADECQPIVARIVSLQGKAEVLNPNSTAWQPVERDSQFCPGDQLRVKANSRAGLQLNNETFLRLSEQSNIRFAPPEDQQTSWLDILEGIAHFISRTRKSLEVRTPYVNASIEGTEFVIRIDETGTDVIVLEGVVFASNNVGSVELGANQAARAEQDQAPVVTAIAKPFNTVAWALYYPPLPALPSKADTLAQATIKAIVENRLEEAAELAKQALETDRQSATAYLAQSYVDQAMFDIPAALANSQKAAQLAPQNALTQARLAEVWLMTGNTRAARESASQAVTIDSELSLAHTVLGFASLREISLDAAKSAFQKAIELDSAAPLPHLGLGLLEIRHGNLEEGREAIETAALLDPNNALLRSYMGKAYYEERRNDLASQQFAMAKELDPNDPTAWFYESILLQSANRPVEALHAQQQAIELNDNRGVYRSRQLLDSDEASRNVALGRIYNDLSFEQQAVYQATDALIQAPTNHSAHRLLADSYVGLINRDAARQSELLQSKLTQPLNLDPLQPQLSNSNLGLLDGNGPADLSYYEYNPLFTKSGLAFQLDASYGENSTWGEDAILAGLTDRFAFSVGQYHAETDGFRNESAVYEQDIYNGFAQFAFSDSTSFQIEVSDSEEEKGDVTRRLLPEFLNVDDFQVKSELSTTRLGIRHALTVNTDLLISAARREYDFIRSQDINPSTTFSTESDRTIDLYEVQLAGKLEQTAWLAGISRQNEDEDALSVFEFATGCPLPSCSSPSEHEAWQTRLYGYLHYDFNDKTTLTGGLSYIKEDVDNDEFNKAYPKLGFQFNPTTGSELRLAAFRNRMSVILPSLYETLEPTQIIGFNQLYDDYNKTDYWAYAAEYKHQLSHNLHAGFSSVFRELETEIGLVDFSTLPPGKTSQVIEHDDLNTVFWLNLTTSPFWSFGVEYSYNRSDLAKNIQTNSVVLAPDGVLELKTHQLPISISYYHPLGFSTTLTATYYNQEGEFVNKTGTETQHGEDNGVSTDLAFNYRFPNRRGSVSLGINNIFDRQINFEDRDGYDISNPELTASPSSFTGERFVFGKITVNVR